MDNYVPPLCNAVNFNGSGDAYTPPVCNAVNFDFIPSGEAGPVLLKGYIGVPGALVKTWRGIPLAIVKTWDGIP